MPVDEAELSFAAGHPTPRLGGVCPSTLLWMGCLMWGTVGCGAEEEQRTLEPARVAMNESVASIYDDGDLVIYEVKAPFQLPIAAPDRASLDALRRQDVAPYGAMPWVQSEQVRVQISWVISNLGPETANVELIIDPWNEFGRYWPGVTVIDEQDGEALPNLSGYDRYIEVPGTDAPGEARVHGVITFDAMQELAIDFATAINIIEYPPPDDGSVPYGASTLVNHAFDIHNSSKRDPLVRGYIPDVIAGLTGFDFGLRTIGAPGLWGLEIVVEVVDTGDQRVLEKDSTDPMLGVPERQYTVGE